MGKIINRIKGILVIGLSALLGLLGIELGSAGGAMLFDDLEYIFGKREPDIYAVKKFIGHDIIAVDAYDSSKQAKIYYDKKTQNWRACKHQPKGYTADVRNLSK